ncbi:MAG: hypothetical protein EAX96_16660 [Candidatus Lokiarchaeota archaeon]|nr:hypothetical protein [Candidatus Lokiarchaeota archaeon]
MSKVDRLYLAAEGDPDLTPDVIAISKKNANKLGIKENDEVIYEDIPGGISGQARVIISSALSDDNVSVNQTLFDSWGDNMSWFGTIEIRPKKEGEMVPMVSKPPKDLTFADQDIKSIIPPEEYSKLEKEEKIPSSISINEEDVDLAELLDKLIDEDIAEDAPKFPISEKSPVTPAPDIKKIAQNTSGEIQWLAEKSKKPISLSTQVGMPTSPPPLTSSAPPLKPISQPISKPTSKPPLAPTSSLKSAPPLSPETPSQLIPKLSDTTQPATSYPTQPATSYPTQPATSYPTKPATSYPTKPATSYPTKPAAIYPTTPPIVSYPEPIQKKIKRPEEFLNLKVELQYGLGGLVLLNQNNFNKLELNPHNPPPIIFQDTDTGVTGGARVQVADLPDEVIRMEPETYETSDIHSLTVNIWSSIPKEKPIVKVDRLDLNVKITSMGIGSSVSMSKRNCLSLEVGEGDIITFEDELIGAWGAGYVKMKESLSDDVIEIEDEIFEATGIGSKEVLVKRNDKTVIPLQSLELGISPIMGENMWDTITFVRNNKDELKRWFSQFLIFKGLKLRWKEANAAINIISTVPDLKGEILAAPKMTSSLQLKAEGLITFNAILIIDISASMLAPDMMCENIAPAVEGIRASMENEEVKNFLARFKEGVNVPRRLGAAFAALLFLAEKVGRGFGEKVSIIRFADQAEALDFDGPYFDSASGKHGILEQAANQIVEKIGNYKGLATNMAPAFLEAKKILDTYNQIEGDDSKPCMVVLLTDGNPTDQDQFIQTINSYFIGNSNVVLYIVGIGNTNVNLMTDIAVRCGGEFFQPDNMGELLIWYSKRARDLIVKLKGGRA